MLVMLDAIAQRFADCDAQAAWCRLTNSEHPEVTFRGCPGTCGN